MSVSSTRADSTITGTDDQPRKSVDEFDAVAVGQAEVEDDEVGLAGSCLDQTLLQRIGLDDVPALGLQAVRTKRRIWRSSSTRSATGDVGIMGYPRS